MKVTVQGSYYIIARKIKEVVNFEIDVQVENGLSEAQILTVLREKKTSPLYAKLKKEDKQFSRLRKISLVNFVQTLPDDEELDTPESLGLETKASGKITSTKEFDVMDALGDEKPKASKGK